MKLAKKCVVGLSTIGLTIGLTACGSDENKEPNEGDITLSDVLNSDEQYEVVVTDNNSEDKGHVVWGGFIGDNKIKGVYLDGTDYGYGYDELKKLSQDEYEQSLKDMGEAHMGGEHPRKLIDMTANVELLTNLGDEGDEETKKGKADAVSFESKSVNKDDKDKGLDAVINEPNYTNVTEKSKESEWSTIKAGNQTVNSDYEDYEMHIKTGEGKKFNLKLDDVEETKDKYDNVSINDYEN